MRETLVLGRKFGKSAVGNVMKGEGRKLRGILTTLLICAVLAPAGCGKLPFLKDRSQAEVLAPQPQTPPEGAAAVRPPEGARTAEQFDTTTADERKKAAAAPKPGGESLLGETVASLGDPAAAGFWLETPLVTSVRQGRVENPATGKSSQVELRPIEGPKTGGSRISLAAMRLIGASLTDLPTLKVFAGG
ncbi:hypothetical protein [Mameliella sp. AT18]|uniref:hypothetical protein n=1 Tax=Mameliella sp. AT18 TaxID=3028385 RepID=UPI00237C4D2A|nr:hypothetical protein [Mameliella sp. AT18]